MSQIRKDLEKLGGVSINEGEDMQSYLQRLLDAVDEKLAEDDALGSKAKGLWDKLSEGVQAFFNAGMEAYNKKMDIAEFPDVEKKAERAKRDDVKVKEDVVSEKDDHEHIAIDDLKDGDDVIVECKDESTFRGAVVEVTKRVVVLTLSEDGKEEEMVIKRDNVDDVIKAPKPVFEEPAETAKKSIKVPGKMVKSKDAEKGKTYLVDVGDNSLVECECIRVMSETTVFEDSKGDRYKIEHDAEVECCFSDEVQVESENVDKDAKPEVKVDDKEKKAKEPKPVKEKKVKVSITDKRIENAKKVVALMNELGLDDSEKRKVCSRIYSTIAKNSKE